MATTQAPFFHIGGTVDLSFVEARSVSGLWKGISPHNISHSTYIGGIPTPLNNMKVNLDDEIPNTWKN